MKTTLCIGTLCACIGLSGQLSGAEQGRPEHKNKPAPMCRQSSLADVTEHPSLRNNPKALLWATSLVNERQKQLMSPSEDEERDRRVIEHIIENLTKAMLFA